MKNQYIKCLSQSNRQWIPSFFFLFFFSMSYAMKQRFLKARYKRWNKALTLLLEQSPVCTPQSLSGFLPSEWIRDRWGLGLMERDRPGATGSNVKCRAGEQERRRENIWEEWDGNGNLFSGDVCSQNEAPSLRALKLENPSFPLLPLVVCGRSISKISASTLTWWQPSHQDVMLAVGSH